MKKSVAVWAMSLATAWLGLASGGARADIGCGESGWSPAVRVDARSGFGGRLVHGTERMGDADGGAAEAWNTATLADGWQEVTRGTNTATVAVLNASGVAVEYGRLGGDAVWGSGKVHVVRDWVAVPDGRTLEIGAGTVVKFTRGAGILVEEGGTLKLSGTEGNPVRLTAAEDDAVGGDTDMREERPVWCYYVDVKGALVDSGWTECRYVDTAHAAGMVAAGLKVGLTHTVTGESVASGLVRVDARSGFGGRLVHGTERMGDAEGGAAEAWNTTALVDGWQEVAKGTNTATVAVLNATGVAVEYGRLVADVAWGSGKVHVVRDWVVVPDGRTLEIGAGAVVKFTRGAGILVEEGGTLKLSGTEGNPVRLTAAEDDAVGGDTDMREERPVWCYYVDVKGTLVDSGWTDCRYVDTAHAAGMVAAGLKVGLTHTVTGESGASGVVRVDARSGFGGRLVHGTERMGDADGGAAEAWNTAALADGWQEVAKGTNTATVAVLNAAGVAVEYGRLGADAVWGSGKVHVVRDWVAVPDGRTLEIGAGTVVKFTRGAGILVEEGGTLKLSGVKGNPVRLTAAEDDAVGGDTDMREKRPVWCYYVDVKGALEDSGWTECAYVDTAHASGMVAAGLKVGLTHTVTGESGASGAVRVDARSGFGGRLVHGTERMGDADGGAAEAWDTAALADGWQEVAKGTNTAEVAVLNALEVAVEYGRLGADAVWGSGKVHVVRDWVAVPSGVTLEIGAGAVVKFTRGTGILVEEGGTLKLSGVEGNPVRLTAAEDDAVGGDTDMREERPVWCHYVDVKGTLEDAGWTECRYVDTAHAAGMVAAGLKVGLAATVTGESAASGAVRVDCRSGFGGRLVHGTERMGDAEGGAAVAWNTKALADGWQEVAKGTNTAEVAVLNASGVAVEYGRLGGNAVWGSGKVHVVRDWVAVPSGMTLEIGAGTVVKFTRGTGILVEEGGTLRLSGTAASPVRLTAAEDDAVGGDTDMREERPVWCHYVDVKGTLEDAGWTECRYVDTAHAAGMVAAGLKVGLARAEWGISSASEGSRLDGKAAVDGVLLTGGDEWATWDTAWDGAARVRAEVVRPDGTVAELGTAGSGGRGLAEWTADEAGRYEVRYEARDGAGTLIRQTSRALVRLGDDVALHAGGIGSTETWEAGKVHVVDGTVTVGNGAALAIERGAVVKFMPGAALVVESGGSCAAEGAVFTHINDDTVGGDTMGDGAASGPVADDYRVSGNVATDAATELRWLTMKTAGTLSSDTVWMGSRVICVTGNVTVASGATLTVLPGAIVKFNPGVSLTVNSGGTLNALGTRAQPIVFTSIKDDEFGGDTNGDGDATTAQPGDWTTIKIAGGTAHFSHASILYSSRNQTTGAINMTGGTVVFDSGEIAHGLYDAVGVESGNFHMTNSVIRDCLLAFRHWARDPIVNCVIYDCGRLTQGGGQHFRNCIFANITEAWEAFGFPQNGTTYNNCCFWNEGGSVLTGEGTQDAMTVCGKNGNIWGDPLFVDADACDFRVSEGSPCVDAGDTAAAPETDYYGQPRASVFGEALADIGIYEVQPRGVAGDVDLVPVSVSADAEASPGGELRVSWVVGNRGGKVASGARRDAFSLVSAGGREVSLGEKVFSQSVAAGGTAKCEAVFRVPPMAEGTWWPKVVVNSQQDIFEGSLIANNARTGETGVEVSLPATAAASGASGTVAAGVPTVLKLHFEAGDGNRMVVLNVPQGVSVAWGFGFVPAAGGTTGAAGTSGTAVAERAPVQFVAPDGVEDVYVVLESGEAGAYEVSTESGKLAVTSVEPGEVPSSGEATLAVSGAGFMPGAAVKLKGNGATVAAESVRVVDSRTISATVDCGKLAAGAAYDVVVESADATATAGKTVHVAAAPGEGKFWARLDVPGSVREGRKVSCSVEYGNSGNADMPAPVIQIDMKGNGTLGYVDGLQGVKTLQFVAAGEEGSAGVLRPGAERRIRFEMLAGRDNRMTLSTSVGHDFHPVDWAEAEDYLAALSGAATRIGLRGGDATDYHAVLRLAQGVLKGENVAVVAGSVGDGAGTSVDGLLLELSGGLFNETAVTDIRGGFVIEGVPDGEYELTAPELDMVLGRIEVAGGGDVCGLAFVMGGGSCVRMRIESSTVLPGDLTVTATPMGDVFGDAVCGVRTVGGEVVFEGLKDGFYDIRGIASGFMAEAVVEVVGGALAGGQDVMLHLENAYSVTGRVENADDLETITVYALGMAHVAKTTLDEDGSFAFDGLASDEYEFVVVGEESGWYGSVTESVPDAHGVVPEIVFERTAAMAETDAMARAIRAGGAYDSDKYLFFEVRQVARHLKEQADTLYRLKTVPLPAVQCAENMATYDHYCELRRQFGLWKSHYEFMYQLNNQTKGSSVAKEGAFLVAKVVATWADIHKGGDLMSSLVSEAENLIDAALAAELGIDAAYFAAVGNAVSNAMAAGDHAISIVKSLDFENETWASFSLKVTEIGADLSDIYGEFERMHVFEEMLNAAASKRKASTRLAAMAKEYKWQHTQARGKLGTLRMFLSLGKSAKKAAETTTLYVLEINGLRRAANFFQPIYEAYLKLKFDGYHDDCLNPIPNPPYPPGQTLSPMVPQSVDPNEMSGPLGAGAARLVAPGEWMTYTVYFENKAEATAAAQEVTVTEQLGGALDWGTFEMVDVGFNNQLDLGLGGKRKGASVTAMTGTAYKVRTELDYNAKTGAAKWYMRIVDESTETRWPRDVYAGFLPPNDATGRGEGHITYRVKLRDDAAAGTVVRASASIVFDYNAAIETDPAWWNTVAEMGTATVDLGNGVETNVAVMVGAPWIGQLPDPGKRPGMRFAGWFTGPNGTGSAVTEESVAAAVAKLYAFWDATAAPELWLDVSWGAVEIGTNGVVKGYGRDGEAAEGMANRYVLTGTSQVNGVKFAGGSFTNTWTNLVINLNAKDAVAVTLEGASVEVMLAGDNAVASGEDCAGVRVDAASALVLQGTGRLAAQGGKCGAGIGGGKLQESGRVEIRSGTVEAIGGEFGAGIGGGLVAPAAGAVVIAGGSVKARGSEGGEDIGGGFGREGTGAPVGAAGTPVHEVEVPLATDALPAEVVVDLGGGKTYRYAGPGHEGGTSLWFWLPDGTYEFAADGDEYGAHVAGTNAAAVFTDPGNANFVAPPVGEVSSEGSAMRAAMDPAYRTSPFEVWTATGLKGNAWDWTPVPPGGYDWDATNAVIRLPDGTNRTRVLRLKFLAR